MRLRSLIPFAAGTVFGVVLLARCGVAPADAGAGGDVSQCSCPQPPDPVVKSGTRLKAIVLKSDDGAQQFVGWWDSKLGIECKWLDPQTNIALDDSYKGHCLPVEGPISLPAASYALLTRTH